jgi:Na+/glutamate symporter
MNWRVFQFGMIFGTILAAYSQHMGASGFQTAADVVAGGALFGVVCDALVGTVRWSLEIERRDRRT